MKLLMTLLALLLTHVSKAQNLPNSFGFSNFSAGNGVATRDAFSLWNNPSLMTADSILLGMSAQSVFSESLFHFTAAAQFPTRFAPIGIGVNQFGDELMNETTASLAIGKQLFDDFSMGINLNYSRVNAQFAEPTSTVYPQISLSYQLGEEISFGFMARNPFSQDYQNPFEQNLQALYSAGFSYNANAKLNTTLQADVLEKDGLSAGLGVELSTLKGFSFSLGGKTKPGFFTAGASVNINQLKIGIGGKQQSPLGFSPQVVMQTGL